MKTIRPSPGEKEVVCLPSNWFGLIGMKKPMTDFMAGEVVGKNVKRGTILNLPYMNHFPSVWYPKFPTAILEYKRGLVGDPDSVEKLDR